MSTSPKNPDFILFTDGSGYKDGYGGWACNVKSPNNVYDLFRMGCIVGATVDRMELTAILEGLQIVMEVTMHERNGYMGQDVRPLVKLFSDRENLVLSIQRVYDRSNAPDLWARFEFYEKFMDIDANHVMRETDYPEFVKVDLHASTARIIAKQYGECVERPPHQFGFE